jgi:AcrR family transcriptional regulator
MPSPKTDRRVKRTQKLLHEAMHQLMAEKRYDDITVQDLIDRADVGRSTFYAHYQSKEDLAVSTLIEMMDELMAAMEESDPQGYQVLPTRILFQHIEENYQIFQSMMRDRGMEFLFERGREFWAERIEERLETLLPDGHEPAVPVPLIASSVAGTFLVLLKWWLDNKLPYPAAEMARMTDQLILPGACRALGVTEDLVF